MQNDIEVVILAAGLGTRMKSSTIKILHRAAGRPIIDYVVDLAGEVTRSKPVMVVGHQHEAVEQHCGDRARYVLQERQLGTGHALIQALPLLAGTGSVLVLSGDVPLTRAETLQRFIEEHRSSGNGATILTMMLPDAGTYGRILRAPDRTVSRIVEAKDASSGELEIREANSGIYLFEAADLGRILSSLSTDNAQGEYYLTDVVVALRQQGRRVGAIVLEDAVEALGVNSRAELAVVEAELMRRHVSMLMSEGVTFRNPSAVHVDTTVRIAPDTVIYPFAVLEGSTSIGRDCTVGPGAHLRDVEVGDGVEIRSGTVAEGSTIGDEAMVGPCAHLRPGTILGRHVKVGNFVETKKAVFGEGAKASHLSYIGDAEIGADVNIGAGTITCNYDGVRKHKTILEDGVFIGSDTQLVAPVRVGKGAYVGAGSTITKDVPADSLALSRIPQKIIEGWVSRKREEKK